MKNCPNCGSQLEDSAVFCTNCGESLTGEPQVQYEAAVYDAPASYDHTAEFSAADVSENKVLCMLIYLMGIVGVIVALLAGAQSPYVAFHVRQALKMSVVEIILAIAAVLLVWTIIVPIAAGVCALILLVLRVIAFFQICGGKAVEPAIIRDLSFLK